MVKTVIREHHWPPSEVGGLYFDDLDFYGLKYWYNDAVECNEQLKAKK